MTDHPSQHDDLKDALKQKVRHHLEHIYADLHSSQHLDLVCDRLISTIGLNRSAELHKVEPHESNWSEGDVVLITYGDSLEATDRKPLTVLNHFLHQYCSDTFNSVHILPFFPYSSDDGFSVIDYSSVNESLGDWDDIRHISSDYHLMADVVINHCSARSPWFQHFIRGEGIGADFFFTASPEDDLSQVVRPRTSELLKEVVTKDGKRYVWCTFSQDQVDFDFRNPEVLLAFVSIIRQYLDNGVKIFRFDAVAFIWKEVGTSCINLEQTHEIVRLLRTLIEHAEPRAIIITETNIPHHENLTYFGNANEAHAIYNFSFPPLLVSTLISGDSKHLSRWLTSMPPTQIGTTYFNFIASHDGIGLRPAEGLLCEEEVSGLVDTMKGFGGLVSWRTSPNGEKKPYEINITLFDALQGTAKGKDSWGVERFLCAHSIMLAIEGIPGIYVHSLLGTHNDYEKVEHTSHNRSINRHRWDYSALEENLADPSSGHAKVYRGLSHLISIRIQQPAFHPNAEQFTLHIGDALFGFWRRGLDGQQIIFNISNISDKVQHISSTDINFHDGKQWRDLIGGVTYQCEELVTFELAPYQTLWLSNLL